MYNLFFRDMRIEDMNNGDGSRVTLFLDGCEHRCKNCQNPQTWEYGLGRPLDLWEEAELFTHLGKDFIDGLTLTGGDPLYPKNRLGIYLLVKKFKQMFPNKTIWLWTGYLYENIKENEEMSKILPFVDVLVDGPYIDSLRNIDLKWRGSSNQRVIDVQATLLCGDDTVILYCD